MATRAVMRQWQLRDIFIIIQIHNTCHSVLIDQLPGVGLDGVAGVRTSNTSYPYIAFATYSAIQCLTGLRVSARR